MVVVKDVSIIVPARNEEEGLAVTLESIYTLIDDRYEVVVVVVVDGDSNDKTVEVAERYPCRVIRQGGDDLGKGRGLIMGFEKSLGEKVIWIDADDTYPVELIPRIVKEMDKYDAVVCSRKYGKENMPLFNRFGNWLFKVMIRGMYGFGGLDPCTGLYGVKRVHLMRMKLTSRNFAIEPEISIKAGRMRLKTLDIPIVYRKRVGVTKLNAVKVGFEDMFTIWKLVFWRPERS